MSHTLLNQNNVSTQLSKEMNFTGTLRICELHKNYLIRDDSSENLKQVYDQIIQ